MNRNISGMSKKELKDYVNQNGFFFHIQCNTITTDEAQEILTDGRKKKMVKTGRDTPTGENIITFKGIASQNYDKGEKSRNGYKYDQNGWDFESYMNNPIILWQHDAQYGWIGNALAFWVDDQGNLSTLFYVDTDTLEERNAVQVRRGYVSAISTGAIPEEWGFEDNETGDIYTREEAETKYGYSNVIDAMYGDSEILTLIVTKASMLENSLVTIGSNEKAIAMQNAIGNHFKDVAEQYKKDHEQKDSAVPYKKYAKADEGKKWDGAQAKENLKEYATDDNGDIDYAKYSKGFAWYDETNKETLGAYKLPHHDVVDGNLETVLSGVEAAMWALLGARGGADIPEEERQAVYNHLKKHYAEFDREAPEMNFTQDIETDSLGDIQNPTETPETKASDVEAPKDESKTEELEKQAETPATAEQAVEPVIEEKNADENEAKLADAIEQIASLQDTVRDLQDANKSQADEFAEFKDSVSQVLEKFITSHNDAVNKIDSINSSLSNIRVSKGAPHIVKQDDYEEKTNALSEALRRIKG